MKNLSKTKITSLSMIIILLIGLLGHQLYVQMYVQNAESAATISAWALALSAFVSGVAYASYVWRRRHRY